MSNDADARIVVLIGNELLDTIHVSGEPVEQPKYDKVEVLNYAIEGIKNRIRDLKFHIEENFDEILYLMNLKKTLENELEELSGNAETES